jgi:hypothetical protein
MPNPRPHPDTGSIAAGDVVRHFLAPGFFALELWPGAAAHEQGEIGGRAIGCIGSHVAGGVIAVEYRAELAAVMRCRVRHAIAPQKAVLAVNADMILVPEYRHRDLDLALLAFTRQGITSVPTIDRPASVAVDLGAPRRLPVGRRPAALKGVLLGLGQARSSRLDHFGIDDLSAHPQPAIRPQQRVEPGEQPLRCTGARQLLAIKPDRFGVGTGSFCDITKLTKFCCHDDMQQFLRKYIQIHI